MTNNATKETTPFVFYKTNVAEAAGVTIRALDEHLARVGRAYDMGEPVWMIADEIILRCSIKRALSPLQQARVWKAAGRT